MLDDRLGRHPNHDRYRNESYRKQADQGERSRPVLKRIMALFQSRRLIASFPGYKVCEGHEGQDDAADEYKGIVSCHRRAICCSIYRGFHTAYAFLI